MSSKELKPCPFCGGKASGKAWSNPAGEFGPGCTDCGVTAESFDTWNTRSQFSSIQDGMGEDVEVVGWLGGNGIHAEESMASGAPFALMTVAQHQRILGASMISCSCWRSHSVNYARGEKPPQTIQTLQAAWDRDQELIFEQKAEISRLKEKLNQEKQKNFVTVPAGYKVVPVDLLQDLHDLASDAVEHHRAAFAGYKLKRQANMEHVVDKTRDILEAKDE